MRNFRDKGGDTPGIRVALCPSCIFEESTKSKMENSLQENFRGVTILDASVLWVGWTPGISLWLLLPSLKEGNSSSENPVLSSIPLPALGPCRKHTFWLVSSCHLFCRCNASSAMPEPGE